MRSLGILFRARHDVVMLFAILDNSNLLAARLQMATTLGFHIILACFGVGMPVLMLAAEYCYLRTRDELWRTLARRWSKSFAVMFAIGAVSGTVLSFELGLLWPTFMETFGSVIGLPFTMEGFAFFLEAIFAGIYLYGWERVTPRLHWWMGVPIAIAGFLSAAFVVTANSWMNCPRGFVLIDGRPEQIDPIQAMLNPATGAQMTHMVLAAYMVTGFGVASYYAFCFLRGNCSEYVRRAMRVALWMALIVTPLQMLVGDWAAKVVADLQPVKLAAMEGHYHTQRGASLVLGGIPDDDLEETKYAIRVPKALSFLAFGDWNAEVRGLSEWPREERPPTIIVHVAFQLMIFSGLALAILSAVMILSLVRLRRFPTHSLFILSVVVSGPLSIVALEAGWTVTEVGRQPWIVQGVMRTRDAATSAPGIWNVFWITLAVYFVLGLCTIIVLRLQARVPVPESNHDS